MSESAAPHFRFLDLPGEIRNIIYGFLLCDFDLPIIPSVHDDLPDFEYKTHSLDTVAHSIDTSILRTSKQIYREAYSVMIKTNQFIHIESNGINFSDALLKSQLRTVTLDRAVVQQFRGYTMRVALFRHSGMDEGIQTDIDKHTGAQARQPYFSFMILGHHWQMFCKVLDLMDYIYLPDEFKREDDVVALVINPNKAFTQSEGEDTGTGFGEYLNAKRQETLLAPFKQLCNFPNVQILGHVDADLAANVKSFVVRQSMEDPNNILRNLAAFRERGLLRYQSGDINGARKDWAAGVRLIRHLVRGSDWLQVAQLSGMKFVNAILESNFTIAFNASIANIYSALDQPQDLENTPTIPHGHAIAHAARTHEHAVEQIRRCRDGVSGTLWRPDTKLQAQMHYRSALFYRAMRWQLPFAIRWINCALALDPTDDAYREENEKLYAWAAGTYTPVTRELVNSLKPQILF